MVKIHLIMMKILKLKTIHYYHLIHQYHLKKKILNFISNLTPKMLINFNPDKSENITNLDRKINSTNLFSNNRLGLSDSLEGGSSVTLGFDYELKNLDNNKVLGLKLGQIFRNTNESKISKKIYNAK